MAYFKGEALDRKVEEFGFTDVEQHIIGVADGSVDWPIGGFTIKAPASSFESVRTLLYSIMHRHGLKELFVVKANYADNTFQLDMKHQPNYKGLISVEMTGRRSSGSHSRPGAVPAVPEDLTSVFSDSLEFDSPPVGVGTTGPTEEQHD